MDFIFRAAEAFLKKHKRLQRYRRVFAFLAAVVVFATTYELILPAITMDRRRAAETPGVEIGVAAEGFEDAEETAEAEEAESDAEADPAAVNTEETRETDTGNAAEAEGAENGGDASGAAYDAGSAAEASSGDNAHTAEGSDFDNADETDHTEGKGSGDVIEDTETSDGTGASSENGYSDDVSDSSDAGSQSTSNAKTDSISDTDPADSNSPDPTAEKGSAETAVKETEPASALTAEGEWIYPASLTFQAQDKSYTVTATFDESAAIPTDTRLEVTEILPGLIYEDEHGNQVYPEYDTYLGKTVEVMDKKGYLEENNLADTRFFDITFRDSTGTVIEPQAPVGVAVRYKETLSAEETVDTVAIHFDEKKNRETGDRENNTELTDTKTQIIPADTETRKDDSGNEKIEEIAFDAEAFSVYAIATTTPGTPVSMTVGSTETITPAYASGVTSSAYTSYEWKSGNSSVASIQSGASSSSAVIKANQAGTATITLNYAYGKDANKATTGKAVFAVTVTEADDPENPGGGSGDDPAGAFTEEDCTAQSGSLSDGISGGMTVTVKETGKLKKISDYHVVVEDASDAYTDDADMLKAYHIYLADQTDAEVTDFDKDLKNGQNLNLRVTLTYDQEQEWFDQAKDIKHYGRDGSEQTISGITFEKDKKTISFNVRGFSDFVITNGSTATTGGGYAVTTNSGSILEGMTFNDANEWQILTKEEGGSPYDGNGGVNKTSTTSTDGNVRVQKNVIPTGKENEFYVYLSIDTKSLLETYLKNATYNVKTSNSASNGYDVRDGTPARLGSVVARVPGNNRQVAHTGSTSNGLAVFHYVFDLDGNEIAADDRMYFQGNDSANNTTWYLELTRYTNPEYNLGEGEKYYMCLGLSVRESKHEPGGQNEVRLTGDDIKVLLNEAAGVVDLNTITDVMGDNIEYLGVVDDKCDGSVSFDGTTLSWVPLPKTNTETEYIDATKVWNQNVAELVYKVRLRVDEEGFNSCATNMSSNTSQVESYRVNNSASVTYSVLQDDGSRSNESADFPIPYIRGLLYDIKVKKVDENGKALPNAKFSLTGTSANTGANIAHDAASDVTQEQLTSDSNGFITITGLPWGTYTLTETTPPPGYRGDSTPHTAELCYTTNSSNLSGSSIDASRKMLASWKDHPEIENRKNVIKVTKAVETINDLPKNLVNHTIFIALKDTGTGEYVKDGSGNILYKTITIENGVPNPLSVSFGTDENEFIDGNTTYDVMELSQVNGATATELHVGDKFTSGDETIQIAAISGTVNGVSSNDANLTDSYTATVNFTNTYSYETSIDFVVNKKWRTNGEEVFPPDGTAVTFTLYRSVGDDSPTEYRMITLDGHADENGETAAWKATFSNLDVFDANHNRFIYKVKETGIPNEYLPYLSDSATDPMGADDYLTLNGGSIWNKQKTTSIIVKKEDDQEQFLPGAKFKLARVWTDSAGTEHETLIGEEFTFTSNDAGGITRSGLISGTYRLTEVSAPAGYIIKDRSVTFTVNATGSGSVISWNGEKPETVKNLLKTNQADDTVTVINTPGGELPHTGGYGFISPQTLCGIMAMAFVLATAVMYSFSGRRGERRYK